MNSSNYLSQQWLKCLWYWLSRLEWMSHEITWDSMRSHGKKIFHSNVNSDLNIKVNEVQLAIFEMKNIIIKCNKTNQRDLIAASGLVILLKLDSKCSFIGLYDPGIWWMTLKNNRAPFLYYIELCTSFQSHSKPFNSNGSYSLETLNLGQNWWFVSHVTLKFDGWPGKTIGHLFYTTSSFMHHFKAILLTCLMHVFFCTTNPSKPAIHCQQQSGCVCLILSPFHILQRTYAMSWTQHNEWFRKPVIADIHSVADIVNIPIHI